MGFVKRSPSLKSGDRAPDFRLQRTGGGEAALPDLIAGGPVLLAFFKVSCPVCHLTFPYLERIYTAGTLSIYGISQNDAEETREFCRAYELGFPMLLDPEDSFPASNAYGITNVPTLFLVEQDGTIASVINGWSRQDILTLAGRAGVNPFRAGESVPEWKPG